MTNKQEQTVVVTFLVKHLMYADIHSAWETRPGNPIHRHTAMHTGFKHECRSTAP